MVEPVLEDLRVITLRVDELEPAVAFYRDVPGFDVEEDPARGEDFRRSSPAVYVRLGEVRLGLHVP